MAKARARHILVSTEEACNNLKTQIEGGGDFAAVAKEHSTCPSGKQGGDLGEFGPVKWSKNLMPSCLAENSERSTALSKLNLAITFLRSPAAPHK